MAFHGRKRRSSQRCVAYLRVLSPYLEDATPSVVYGDGSVRDRKGPALQMVASLFRQAPKHNGMNAGFRAGVLGSVVYVLGAPTEAGCARMIVHTAIAACQLVAKGGYFLSGGIALGRCTDGEVIPAGPGVDGAQAIEAGYGMRARVVISDDVPALSLGDGLGLDAVLRDIVRCDGDGRRFVHYAGWPSALGDLSAEVLREWLQCHRQGIEERRRSCEMYGTDLVGSLWLARYHNRCCRDVLGADELDGYLVEPSVSV